LSGSSDIDDTVLGKRWTAGIGTMTTVNLNFDKMGGLIPAIVQEFRTGEVLMMAYMNRESWGLTLETGIAHYWSRSRDKLWKKGETSGHIQEVKEIRIDCDGDCILLKVNQVGKAACHTGYRSCFYTVVEGDGVTRVDGVRILHPQE
jgi:phosphoribosyl-AMP cyclohydrolase